MLQLTFFAIIRLHQNAQLLQINYPHNGLMPAEMWPIFNIHVCFNSFILLKCPKLPRTSYFLCDANLYFV